LQEYGEVIISSTSRILDEKKHEFKFSVKDSGIGIREDAKENIFKPFTQAENSITKKYHGSGLGLAISKRLAELMGGMMWFDSVENQGSEFSFTIVTWIPPVIPTVPNKIRDSKTMLIVISNPILLDSLTDFGKRIGFDTILTARFPEEVSLSSKCHFALIEIPKNSKNVPKQFLQLIEKLSTNNCVIITTGTRVPELDNHRYLKKPIKFNSLSNAILDFGKEFTSSTHPAKTPPEQSNLRILVAEDNPVNQKVIVKLLSSMGYENVDTVDNGLEAVLAVSKSHFDVILMDMMMPGMGGIEATQIIRKTLVAQPVIVALTANAFSEDKKKCLEAGMNEIITKPINKNELMAFLHSCKNKDHKN